MRKFFEGHSFIGLALIFSVLFLGLFLRFYDLSSLSPWTDELASWWYLRHLDEIFFRESHSPLYYGILRLFLGTDATVTGIRTFTAAVSAIHLIEFFFLGQRAFSKKQFLVFWILVCLCPADIVYARMARHYAWLLEGAIVYLLLIRGAHPRWMIHLTAVFMSFIHIFFVVPVGLMALRSKRYKDIFLTVPALLYYLFRILTLGQDTVRGNVSWNSDSFLRFLELTVNQFLGDAYPHSVYYPVSSLLALVLVVVTFSWILLKRKDSGRDLILVTLGSMVVIEGLSFWLNLRSNRYIIYLISFWIVALADTVSEKSFRGPFIAFLGSLALIIVANPLKSYPWEREAVEEWRQFRTQYPDSQQLVCSNIYQSDYYKLGAGSYCGSDLERIDVTKSLVYFDLNNRDNLLLVNLMNIMEASDYRKLKNGVMVYLKPRINNGKSQR